LHKVGLLAEALLQKNNGDYVRAFNYLSRQNTINDLSEPIKTAYAGQPNILDGPEIDARIKELIQRFKEIEAKYEKLASK